MMAEFGSRSSLRRRGSSYSSIPEHNLSGRLSRPRGSDPEIGRKSGITRETQPVDTTYNDNSINNKGDDSNGNKTNDDNNNNSSNNNNNNASNTDIKNNENGNKMNEIDRGEEKDNEITGEINPAVTTTVQSSIASLDDPGYQKIKDQDILSYRSSRANVRNHSIGPVSSVSKGTPVHHYGGSQDFGPNKKSRNVTRMSKDTQNFVSRVGGLSVLSKTSSYDHGDIVDENLLLSAARIDSTLLRLFSRSRDGEKTKTALETEDKLLPFLNYSDSDLISIDPVLWRVHPMESAHKETLEQEMEYLEENVRPVEILRHLYMDEVLTHMDYNTITRTEGQGEKAVTRLLMKTLMRRGDKAFPGLISALQALHYSHVTERLQDAALKLRMGMEEEKSHQDMRSNTIFSRKNQHHHFGLSPSYQNLHGTITASALSPNIFSTPDQYHHYHHHHHHTNDDGDNFNDNSNSEPGKNQEQVTDDVPGPKLPVPTGRSGVIAEEKLQEHLSGLDEELKALHEDVTALKTARSQSLATGRNATKEGQSKEERKPQKSSTCVVL